MKARRFFAFVAGAAMLFGVGCTPDGGKTGGDEAMAEIAVNPSSFATTLEGGEQVIAVTSNATWTVSCDQADVTVEPLTGEGNGSVTITVPAAAAREFKVVFDAQKQTMIPALGTSTTTTAKAEVVVSQNAGGVNQSNFLYYEKVGEDVEKITTSSGSTAWPYIDQFNGWTPEGDAAANVTYAGQSASVRHSGNAYQPTADAVGISGAPYVFLNKVPAQAHFVIENIAVTGGSNYIFTYNVSCQNAYNGGTPGFATVDGSLVHLELGYDGQTWDAVDCTFAPNGGNGWYAVQAEFKVKADATVLYARFTYEAPASNGGGRFDDFKLVEGGNGTELVPEAPQQPEAPEKPEGAVTIPYSEPFTTSQGWFTINNVVLGEGLTYVWIFDSQYSCMKASAFKNGAVPSESWLISPEITLAGTTAPAVSFEHCHKFAGTPADELTLWISEDKGTNWNQLTIPVYGSNSDYTFVANTIDLTSYVGKNVQIAFKYVATSTHAGTWEIRNFKVAEGNGSTTEPEQPGQGGGETPETPEVPVIPEGGTAIEFTTDSVKAAIPDITTNGYGSQNVTSYSTFLTWDVFAACKLCLPPAGDYANANCLQMQGNTDAAKQGRVGNVTATPKRITKVIVESYNAKYTPNFNLALGTEQVVGTSVPANMIPASSMTTSSVVEGALTKYVSTYEVTSGDYTYFAIYKNTTGAFYFTKIRVEYAE
ncbi:MAG: BACON domain-containing protein [Alistipes sp.]|nr:BACON domain-containing protein [Alistipes sp.]